MRTDDLPDHIKQRVLEHLEMDNFRSAKALYDAWVNGAYQTDMTNAV